MDWRGALTSTAWNLALIVAIVVPLLLCVAYLTLWERKLIGWIQIRIGPNRVGPAGLLQPVADGVKLLLKEIILPTNANKGLFLLAPVLMLTPALAAWAVIPFAPEVVLADINAGLLYIMALSSMGVELQVRLSRRDALGGADGVLRAGDGLCAGSGADGVGQPQPVGHRQRPGPRHIRLDGAQFPVVELAAARADAGGVLRQRRRRDQPRAVRRGRGRIGDRRRAHGRVLGDELRAVLPRRVHEHDPHQRADGGDVLRRLAGALGQRGDELGAAFHLVVCKNFPGGIDVPVVPRDFPALPL